MESDRPVRDRAVKRPLPRLALLTAVAAAGCGGATEPTKVTEGVPFTLAPGEVALVEAGAIEVGFGGVAADSRCPTDVTCIVAGDAAVEVWVRKPSEPRASRTLHTDPALGDRVDVFDFELRLLALEPLPRTDRQLVASDYRARLELR